MSKKKELTEDEVFRILKKFTLECVYGGDFDQGNSEEDTLSILKSWWGKEKNKYSKPKTVDLTEGEYIAKNLKDFDEVFIKK